MSGDRFVRSSSLEIARVVRNVIGRPDKNLAFRDRHKALKGVGLGFTGAIYVDNVLYSGFLLEEGDPHSGIDIEQLVGEYIYIPPVTEDGSYPESVAAENVDTSNPGTYIQVAIRRAEDLETVYGGDPSSFQEYYQNIYLLSPYHWTGDIVIVRNPNSIWGTPVLFGTPVLMGWEKSGQEASWVMIPAETARDNPPTEMWHKFRSGIGYPWRALAPTWVEGVIDEDDNGLEES